MDRYMYTYIDRYILRFTDGVIDKQIDGWMNMQENNVSVHAPAAPTNHDFLPGICELEFSIRRVNHALRYRLSLSHYT